MRRRVRRGLISRGHVGERRSKRRRTRLEQKAKRRMRKKRRRAKRKKRMKRIRATRSENGESRISTNILMVVVIVFVFVVDPFFIVKFDSGCYEEESGGSLLADEQWPESSSCSS